MKLLDSRFQCCADLQELFQPISPDLSALQLSQGSLEGRLQIFNLGSFRLSLLETNQELFLSSTRRPAQFDTTWNTTGDYRQITCVFY